MDWLRRLRELVPFGIDISVRRIVRLHILDSYELEECRPKVIRRERPFWREHRLDSYHLMPDGTIKHDPL